ncbi:MAG: biotin--[acetyl-CoA-carboxylase] ligase [Burkholderiales bacterium]|nr:biotin--[acetyl-CoA-carboxylase] ligase [Burkholderiales bacterium]
MHEHLHWGAEALWQQLEPLLPGLSVEVVARLDSTNTRLLERARTSGREAEALGRRQADTQPCLLVAEHQTRGRGRQGKVWQSSAGASLTFSLSLVLRRGDWSGLSLAVGLALADALDPPVAEAAPRIALKWPNDLLVIDDAPGRGRKLGGILIESAPVGDGRRLAVIGVGLNVLPQPALDESPLGSACLQEIDYGLTAPLTLARVAPALVHGVLAFDARGLTPSLAGYERRDWLAGRAVTTTLADLPGGVAEGIAEDGALLLRVGNEHRRLLSGEVSVRIDNTQCGAAC